MDFIVSKGVKNHQIVRNFNPTTKKRFFADSEWSKKYDFNGKMSKNTSKYNFYVTVHSASFFPLKKSPI